MFGEQGHRSTLSLFSLRWILSGTDDLIPHIANVAPLAFVALVRAMPPDNQQKFRFPPD